jgi:hypothetical protein
VDRDWHQQTDRRRIPVEYFERDVQRGPPTSQSTSRKYPKQFKDFGREYPRRDEKYYEYPANLDRSFNYSNQTNNPETTEDPGYGRTITTPDRALMGVSRHPVGERKRLDRFDEVIKSKVPFMEKEVRYPKGSSTSVVIPFACKSMATRW